MRIVLAGLKVSVTSLLLMSTVVWTSPSKAAAPCGDIADSLSHGQIAWTQNAIVVQGTAVPNLADPSKNLAVIKRETQRAATLDAYRNAAEVLAGVMVSGDTTAAALTHVVSNIRTFVQQPEICKAKYYSDGGIDMVVKVPIVGNLLAAMLPSAGTAVAKGPSAYTGLIVDASALPFQPALAPRLLAADHTVLFGPQNVHMAAVKKRGIVQYVYHRQDIDPARVGKRPLRVKATKLGQTSPSDLILDTRGAKALENRPAFLGAGRMVIMMSPVRPIECAHLFPQVADRMIDWKHRLVLAKGHGKVDFQGTEDNALRLRMMERAAQVDAQARLLETMRLVVDDHKSLLASTSKPTMHFRGMVKNAVRCGAKYYRNGTAEVVLAAPLDGLWLTTFGPDKPNTLVRPPGQHRTTGVIIDATGLGFTPVLAPTISTPDHTTLYAYQEVAPAYRLTHGVAAYHRSVEAARTDRRTGDAPLIIKAVNANRHAHHIIIAKSDATKLQSLTQWIVIKRQGRVAIITEHLVSDLK